MKYSCVAVWGYVVLVGVSAPLASAYAQQPPSMPSASAPSLPAIPSDTMPPVPAIPAIPGVPNATQPSLPMGMSAVTEQSGTPGMPTVPGESSMPAAPSKQYSFGSSSLSVLFLPLQIDKMKNALRAYEDVDQNAKAAIVQAPEANVQSATVEPAKPAIEEPGAYPSFFLNTIVYRSPSDWTIWMNGHKISSRKNDTDVRVLSVSRQGATFSWTPIYWEAIKRRREENKFAPLDSVKHKLSVKQAVHQDDSGRVTFSLRQNQSFPVGYFRIFEGYVENEKSLPPLVESSAAVVGSLPLGSPGGVMPASPPVTAQALNPALTQGREAAIKQYQEMLTGR